jgi:hypothetical protein
MRDQQTLPALAQMQVDNTTLKPTAKALLYSDIDARLEGDGKRRLLLSFLWHKFNFDGHRPEEQSPR